ncbi:hypothetical protein K490DRAFT_53157 [Saccharata proteae CBS 121410]|uniref:Uncharacterized protein n=1 Tax=Saccharata proteae CBS 121410 TaxID=1314787 RepID=A0A9P4I4J7_9PEZI|nr:hypothetical protein K490DRAFT_53157 [Saccharata proteae CBS 121410]
MGRSIALSVLPGVGVWRLRVLVEGFERSHGQSEDLIHAKKTIDLRFTASCSHVQNCDIAWPAVSRLRESSSRSRAVGRQQPQVERGKEVPDGARSADKSYNV